MPLFEVVILEKPTKKAAEEGAVETLVFGPAPVIAKDTQSAAINAVLSGANDKVKSADPSRLEVLVRPF